MVSLHTANLWGLRQLLRGIHQQLTLRLAILRLTRIQIRECFFQEPRPVLILLALMRRILTLLVLTPRIPIALIHIRLAAIRRTLIQTPGTLGGTTLRRRYKHKPPRRCDYARACVFGIRTFLETRTLGVSTQTKSRAMTSSPHWCLPSRGFSE